MKPEEVPFYCRLCQYNSRTERDLNRHVKGYRPHKMAVDQLAKEGKPIPEVADYLVRNDHPLVIDGTLMQRLSEADSKRVWSARVQGVTVSTKEALETMALKKEAAIVTKEGVAETCQIGPIISILEPDAPPLSNNDLPLLDDEAEYDLLKDILADDSTEFDDMQPEERIKIDETTTTKDLVTVMTELQQMIRMNC
jgi:hypothetical protein